MGKAARFPGLRYWAGQALFARALRALHLLVKKEMLDLANFSTCEGSRSFEGSLGGFPTVCLFAGEELGRSIVGSWETDRISAAVISVPLLMLRGGWQGHLGCRGRVYLYS